MENASAKARARVPRAVLPLIVAVWLAIDQATKVFFDSNWEPGDAIAGPFLGLVQFRLVHNTGMAWGLFGDSTFALGVVSVAVCVVLVAYFVVAGARMNAGQVMGLALVVAGGIGNAIDRFTLGYVVDFIEFSFFDFPVFNVADIGVTCGFVIFIAGMWLSWREEDRAQASHAAPAHPAEEPGADSQADCQADNQADGQAEAPAFAPAVAAVPAPGSSPALDGEVKR